MGLFKPAWQNTNTEKALKVVEKETRQEKLAEIAQDANDIAVRFAAADKLIDRTDADGVYSEIAGRYMDNSHREDICSRALNSIADLRILFDTVKNVNTGVTGLRHQDAAIRRIIATADQSLLVNIAMENVDLSLSVALIRQLRNQGALAEIAKKDSVYYLCAEAALNKLTDLKALDDVARNAKSSRVRVMV